MSFYRLQTAPAESLLSRAGTVTQWVGQTSATCSACQGRGETLDGERCSACQGDGTVLVSDVAGISACKSVDELLRYFVVVGGEVTEDHLLVVVDGDLSEAEDMDSDLGAVLLDRVTAIEAVVPVTEQLLAEHGARFVRDYLGDAVKIAWL